MTDTALCRPLVATDRLDARRGLQLALAVVWLLDGLLQMQPFMFTAGPNGFSGMLHSMAPGNPAPVYHSLTWNASIIFHHPVATNLAFALIQVALGVGIALRPTLKWALACSVVWSLFVWWFGEALGGLFTGSATPLAGGPGAALFYALVAVLLWPARGGTAMGRFAAATAIGERAAAWTWTATWVALAVLCVVGGGRNGADLSGSVSAMQSGEPGWLTTIDRHVETLLAGHGGLVAIVVAALFLAVAASVHLGDRALRAGVVVVSIVFLVIWVAVENFGGILAGGATDPNSGPVVVLLALCFWPLSSATRPTAVAS